MPRVCGCGQSLEARRTTAPGLRLLATVGLALLPDAAWGWVGGRAVRGAQKGSHAVGTVDYRVSRDLVRMDARKRSKVRAGPEEVKYFQQLMWGDNTPHEEGSRDDDDGIDWEDQEDQEDKYLVRDRRVMRISDEERAYYDRLNAYRSERETPPLVTKINDDSKSSATVPALPMTRLPSQETEAQKSLVEEKLEHQMEGPAARKLAPKAAALHEAYSPEWYVSEMSRRNDEQKPALALSLWDKLRKGTGFADRKPQPTLRAYREALRACYLLGDLNLGKALLKELAEYSVGDMYAGGLDWAIRLLCRARRYFKVINLFEAMSGQGVSLRVSSFNILMEELAGIKRWREVIKVLTLMRAYKVAPNSDSFSLAITAHVALGDMQCATRALAEMTDLGLAPSEKFVSMWSELAMGGATEESREGVEGAEDLGEEGGGLVATS